MGIVANIACKTAGVVGMGAVLYDAVKIGGDMSGRVAQNLEADHFIRLHDTSRTLDRESFVDNAIQKRVKDFRMNTPLVNIYGKIKGALTGFFDSLGKNLIPVTCASLALAGKGRWAKAGAWGLVISGLYTVLKEGFGFGKHTPMG